MSLKKARNTVKEKDLVLIYIEDQPAFFARVEGFTPDHKPNWWHVKLLILNVPLRVISWILRLEQLYGEEPFTMGGTPIRIEKVEAPIEKADLGSDRSDFENQLEEGKKSQVEPVETLQRPARILSLGRKNDSNEQ